MHDDDNDDQPTREQILRDFGWQEGEREAEMADLAERQRRDAEAHAAQRPPTHGHVAKGSQAPAAQPRSVNAAAMTKEWADYVERRIKKHGRSVMRATAGVLVAEERQRAAADNETTIKLDAITVQLAALQKRITQLEEAAAKTAPTPIRLAS